MKKLTYILGVFALALTLGVNSANATIVSPPVIELEAGRGDQLANTIKIKNDGDQAESYTLSVEAFQAAGEEGQPTFVSDASGATSWVSFAFDTLTLQPGQSSTIPFTVQIPESAPAGGHYVAVFAETAAGETQSTGVGISARLGSLVLINVEGNTIESARIAEFSSDKDTYSMLPVDFNVRVENNGNTHVKPFGEIVVRGFFGNEATRLQVNADGGNVLPNSVRRFTTTWGSDEEPSGFFARYAKQKEEKLFGKYTAELSLVYGDGKVAKSDIQFWVVPAERIIVDLVILVIVVLVIIWLVKQYNKWLIEQYRKGGKKS
jgi:hypothetical protein